ncbi:MAG: isoprenylcysteine carboxylmethyltransferase family protein [Acidobacteria bacterium]|nr:isoprenylcysteine carboxylmethyltransferase family protein [Acidobacteriota bacterium]
MALSDLNQVPPAPRVTWARVARRIRVPLSFLFAAAYVWLAAPTALSLAVGMPVAALGLALRAAAAGHIRKDRELTTSGPYAYTRNPLYLGSLLLGLGFAMAARNPWIVIGLLALLLGIYWPLIIAEERYLRAHFPGYDQYAESVPRLLPRIVSRASKLPAGGPEFSIGLYRHHREYRALIGAVLVCVILVVKMILRGRP